MGDAEVQEQSAAFGHMHDQEIKELAWTVVRHLLVRHRPDARAVPGGSVRGMLQRPDAEGRAGAAAGGGGFGRLLRLRQPGDRQGERVRHQVAAHEEGPQEQPGRRGRG
eukprot:6060328-Prymnesium_polylepis.1